jgi:hypothetical protein
MEDDIPNELLKLLIALPFPFCLLWLEPELEQEL